MEARLKAALFVVY